jgi:hypothetical protein
MTRDELNQLATVGDLESLYNRIVNDLRDIISKSANNKEFFTPREFSQTTGMKYSTIIHYCNTGQLKARQERSRGAWQIHTSEIKRYMHEAEDNTL